MMGKSRADKEYKYIARKVGKMLDEMEGWENGATSRHCEALYGRQKSYTRTTITDDEEDDL